MTIRTFFTLVARWSGVIDDDDSEDESDDEETTKADTTLLPVGTVEIGSYRDGERDICNTRHACC